MITNEEHRSHGLRGLAARLGLLAIMLVPVMLLGGCALNDRQSTFDVAGPVSGIQLDVFKVTLWVSIGIFVVVSSLLIFAVFRFRAPDNMRANEPLPPQTHGNALLEFTLTMTSVLLLVVIAVPSLRGIFRTAAPPRPQDALVVNVTGHQWWWEFEYPDQGVVTANELRIPLGRSVLLNLKSADVIHSFWVPKLAGKVDLIPNQHNQMWLEASTAGTYFGQCADFCGTSHANMRFRVMTQNPMEFTAWINEQKQPAHPSPDPLAQQGQQIFLKGPRVGQSCATCHTVKGINAMGLVGPNLTHFASRTTMAAGLMDNNDANVARWLTGLDSVKPGNKMLLAHLALDPEEVRALTAFLRTLK